MEACQLPVTGEAGENKTERQSEKCVVNDVGGANNTFICCNTATMPRNMLYNTQNDITAMRNYSARTTFEYFLRICTFVNNCSTSPQKKAQ